MQHYQAFPLPDKIRQILSSLRFVSEWLVVFEVQKDYVVVCNRRRGEKVGILDNSHFESLVRFQGPADRRRRCLPEMGWTVYTRDDEHADGIGFLRFLSLCGRLQIRACDYRHFRPGCTEGDCNL